MQWQVRPVAGTGSNDHMSLGEVTFIQELTDTTQPAGYTITSASITAGSAALAFDGLNNRFAVSNSTGAIGAKWAAQKNFKGIILRGPSSFNTQYAREIVIENRDEDVDPWVERCRLYLRPFAVNESRTFSLEGQAEAGGSRYWKFSATLNYFGLTDVGTMTELEGLDPTGLVNILRDFKSFTPSGSVGGTPSTFWFNGIFGDETGRFLGLPNSVVIDMGVPRVFTAWKGTARTNASFTNQFPKAFTIDKSPDNSSYANVYTQTSGGAPALSPGETKTWTF